MAPTILSRYWEEIKANEEEYGYLLEEEVALRDQINVLVEMGLPRKEIAIMLFTLSDKTVPKALEKLNKIIEIFEKEKLVSQFLLSESNPIAFLFEGIEDIPFSQEGLDKLYSEMKALIDEMEPEIFFVMELIDDETKMKLENLRSSMKNIYEGGENISSKIKELKNLFRDEVIHENGAAEKIPLSLSVQEKLKDYLLKNVGKEDFFSISSSEKEFYLNRLDEAIRSEDASLFVFEGKDELEKEEEFRMFQEVLFALEENIDMEKIEESFSNVLMILDRTYLPEELSIPVYIKKEVKLKLGQLADGRDIGDIAVEGYSNPLPVLAKNLESFEEKELKGLLEGWSKQNDKVHLLTIYTEVTEFLNYFYDSNKNYIDSYKEFLEIINKNSRNLVEESFVTFEETIQELFGDWTGYDILATLDEENSEKFCSKVREKFKDINLKNYIREEVYESTEVDEDYNFFERVIFRKTLQKVILKILNKGNSLDDQILEEVRNLIYGSPQKKDVIKVFTGDLIEELDL